MYLHPIDNFLVFVWGGECSGFDMPKSWKKMQRE